MLEKIAKAAQGKTPQPDMACNLPLDGASLLTRIQALEEGLTAVDRTNDQTHDEFRHRLARIEAVIGL